MAARDHALAASGERGGYVAFVPPGYVIVPEDATRAMCDASYYGSVDLPGAQPLDERLRKHALKMKKRWRLMLEAAPRHGIPSPDPIEAEAEQAVGMEIHHD